MPVICLIEDEASIPWVLPWVARFARGRKTDAHILCARTGQSAHSNDPRSNTLTDAVEHYLQSPADQGGMPDQLKSIERTVQGCMTHNSVKVLIKLAKDISADMLVHVAEDTSGLSFFEKRRCLIKSQSPCHVVTLYGGAERSIDSKQIFCIANDGPNDRSCLHIATRIANPNEGVVTLARVELGHDQVSVEVGERELSQLQRDAGVEKDARVQPKVYALRDRINMGEEMNTNGLVVIGSDSKRIRNLVASTTNPTIAVVQKPRPRLRAINKHLEEWNPKLSPSDHADLIQTLRRGSKLSTDFITMLSLATVVASMGLLQDSTAVVIGSMLLAPLMTPMLGCGLFLAQANPRMGNRALLTVGVGLFLTLIISFLLGLITPSVELTSQILARGSPDVLDLVIAAASATAAAYALARPNLVGSIAGVAIATALVPPLCSIGLSLAASNIQNAIGAGLLFATNFVAIVLGAAATFRLMGVTPDFTGTQQRKWVKRVTLIFSLAALIFIVPLQISLSKRLNSSKLQPITYPLRRTVLNALQTHIEQTPHVELISAGRPYSEESNVDVILLLSAPSAVSKDFSNALIDIVHKETGNEALTVEIHCMLESWQHRSTPATSKSSE